MLAAYSRIYRERNAEAEAPVYRITAFGPRAELEQVPSALRADPRSPCRNVGLRGIPAPLSGMAGSLVGFALGPRDHSFVESGLGLLLQSPARTSGPCSLDYV